MSVKPAVIVAWTAGVRRTGAYARIAAGFDDDRTTQGRAPGSWVEGAHLCGLRGGFGRGRPNVGADLVKRDCQPFVNCLRSRHRDAARPAPITD